MIDKIKVEERLHWDPLTNTILVLCFKHTKHMDLDFCSMSDMSALVQGILCREIHHASEVTVFFIRILSENRQVLNSSQCIPKVWLVPGCMLSALVADSLNTSQACSSSQRKEALKAAQSHNNLPSVNLLHNMKVHWSSTYDMLYCAVSHHLAVDKFIFGVGAKETNANKQCKLSALALHEEEWMCVQCFCNLLQHADSAQQAFSMAKILTLQLALPAIEQLLASWEKASMKSCYKSFVPALNAGMAKLNAYYKHSAESDVQIMAMEVLELSTKLACFHKNWSSDLISEVEDAVQAKYPGVKSIHVCKSSSRCKSAHPNIDNTDSEDDTTNCKATDVPSNAWMDEWKAYLNMHKDVLEGMGIV
ncbi:hypothetical protein EI94DRAFT_1700527 [Lactarius quietus]|nr:hypothetical protein EI94DRAFT_1700527 [Lactarius quietus]